MSARLLKKVLKEQEQQKHRVIGNEEEDDDDEQQQLNGDDSEPPVSAAPSSLNPFDLLNEGDDDDVDGDDEDEPDQRNALEVGDKTLTRNKERPSSKSSSDNAASTSKNKSKKKKKKKGKESSSGANKQETPVDVALDDLTLDVSSSSHQLGPNKPNSDNARDRGDVVKKSAPSILQVDPKHLNAENELRRIFGSKVVKSFEKSNQSSTSRQVQVRGARRGHHIRKTVLVSPSDHWERWDGSLSMEFLETKDGYHYFRYVHSSSYSQAQGAFEAAQAIHDLNGVASVLMYHPYHLDSLVTLADYFKFAGEPQRSAELIAKCLYALECAWHPMFTPLQGNCQLKFSHDTNKPLFKALFTHMRNMDRRGCHRSALEVCKFLLALDSDDPMGAMFCLDYCALRAAEYAWLERFSEDYRSDTSLWLFPNFSYSLAVCRFYLEQEESSHGTSEDTTKASSADLMNQALMLHPSVVKKLVAKVPLKDQAWTNILKNSFFRSDQIGIPSLDHLINIYVERNYLIWRLPDLQKLLRNGALLVIETLEHDKSAAKDWACVRKEAFSSNKNEYGHLLVQDFSDTVQTLPPDNVHNFLVDMRGGAQIGGQVANQPVRDRDLPPPDIADRNPLAVLFESLLPWNNYGATGDGVIDENRANGQGQDHEGH